MHALAAGNLVAASRTTVGDRPAVSLETMLVERRDSIRTYMITAEGAEHAVLGAIERAVRRGVDLVQLRLRTAPARRLETLGEKCLERVPELRERLLVNGRLDVALAIGASGVHLPSAGLPVAAVRRHVPEAFRIGVSTHRSDEVRRAEREGASFAVFGPVFPTSSKPGHPGVGLEALATVVRSASIPVFAIGGIGPETLDSVLETGVAGVAGISTFQDDARLASLLTRLSRGVSE